jgi:endonuclease/exonuclease/phosphatase family metal-dependent hydrolase
MDFKIVNPSNGRSGGVLLLWRKELKIEQIFSAPNYIDVKITEGLYGEPRWEDKYKTWDKLREPKNNSTLPWVVMGDFNEILYSHEKEGGNPRPQSYMQAFRDALADCELDDMEFSGEVFTWKRERIQERLDQAVASGSWLAMHPNAKLLHLEYIRSDHHPIFTRY